MNQKKYMRALIVWPVFTGTLLVFSQLLLLGSVGSMTRQKPYVHQKTYDTHVVFITNDQNLSFWDSVYRGISELAEENEVAVEWRQASRLKGSTVSELIDAASTVAVDGILTCADGDEKTVASINNAVQMGIPVITLGGDAPSSARHGCVGVENYALGNVMGDMLVSLFPACNNTVIFVQNEREAWQVSDRIFAAGINNVMRKHPRINVEFLPTGEESLTIETTIRDVVLQKRELDAIICRSAEDTVTCANAVIENNLVGNIRIIGYNENEEILEYIQKGIVEAAITTDGETIGKNAMESFLSYYRYNWTNEFISNRIDVIRAENVQTYLDKYEHVG